MSYRYNKVIFILVFLISFPVFAQVGQGALLNRAADLIRQVNKDRNSTRCNPKDNFTGIVGGIGSCNRFGQTTAHDLTCWDRRSPVNFTREFRQTDELEDMSANFFYQELALNSKKHAECRSKVITNFFKDPAARRRMVNKARDRFNEMKPELLALFRYKTELESERRQKRAKALAARMNFDDRPLVKQIDEIKETITKMIISMPLGYDPDVATVIRAMGEDGKFDADAFAHAVVVAKQKYDATIAYFKKRESSGEHGSNFCIDRDFRRIAQKSGQTDLWLDTMPATNRGETLLRDRLRCRLNASYGKGPARITAAFAVAGIATTIFPLTAVPGMALRGVAMAQSAAKAVSGINAVSMLMQVEMTRRACFTDNFVVNASRRQCDVQGEFNQHVNEVSGTGCAIAGSMLASYIPMKIPMHIVRYVRRAVSTTTNRN